MLIGRFLMIVPILALAGNLASKKLIPASAGTFKTEGLTFIVLLDRHGRPRRARSPSCPPWRSGPIVEHYLMGAGTLF